MTRFFSFFSAGVLALLLAACNQTLAPDVQTLVPDVDAEIAPAAVIQTISQTSTPASTGSNLFAQTFTPTVAGFVTKITIYHGGIGTGTPQISFYQGAGPVTAPVYVQPVTWSNVAGPQQVTLTTPLPVVANQTYTYYPEGIALLLDTSPNSTDLYPGGELWIDNTNTFSAAPLGWQPYSVFLPIINPVAAAAFDSDLAFVIIIDDLIDISPPALTVPADVTLEAPADTDPGNTGTATATDDFDPNPTITWSDVVAPGTCTANYTITRSWNALDASGNFSGANQVITVQDTTPPAVIAPSDITVYPGDSVDPADTGTATASDAASGVTVTYGDTPTASGITRTWTATDDCGNVVSADQSITVLTPQDALGVLIADVESLGLQRGIENSLVKKLSNAIRNLDDGDDAGARDKLMSFIDEVNAQTGKQIRASDAPDLISLAQRILAAI